MSNCPLSKCQSGSVLLKRQCHGAKDYIVAEKIPRGERSGILLGLQHFHHFWAFTFTSRWWAFIFKVCSSGSFECRPGWKLLMKSFEGLPLPFEGLQSFAIMNHFPFSITLTFSLFHSQEMLNHGCKRLAQSKPLHWKSLTLAFFWRWGFLELKYTFEGEVLKISKKLYLLSCFVSAFRLI